MPDRFDVKRAGRRTVIVSHPLTTAQFFEVQDPNSFWTKSKEEQRLTAIRRYWNSIDPDPEQSDPDLVRVIFQDAKDAGVDFDGDADV